MSLLLMLWLSTRTVLPKGVILVKGATPSASDASTPLPENGSVAAGRYRNAYFGLTYPIPAGWKEQPAGPPPSDSGVYVLSELALIEAQHTRAHVQITAQDLFFSLLPASGAKEIVDARRRALDPRYAVEDGPADVTIAGRKFYRLAYGAPRTGLHWRVLSADTRCHALTFTFTGTDTAALDAGERALGGLSISDAGAPRCLAGYARENVVSKTDPEVSQHHVNTIPVRIVVDREGAVKHVHVLSAFPEQSQAILTALRTWRFKPYVVDGKAVEVETGLELGLPRIASAR
jgi:hypothetical protein